MFAIARTAVAALVGLTLASAAMAQKSHQFDNDSLITINDNASASPYQTGVLVTGISAPIGNVKVVLRGLTHSFLTDLGVLLVGPSGQSVVLMGRVGGNGPGVTGATFTFSQDALPLSTSGLVSPGGRYRPTRNPSNSLAFAAPAPAGPWGTSLDAFKGQSANGIWWLYVNDEADSDTGSITGWSLLIDEAPSYTNPRAFNIPAAGTSGPAAVFPSTAIVDGLQGTVRSVQVMVSGLSHTYQRDLRLMLQGPGGQTCMLYGNCGDSTDFSSADLVFDDSAPAMPLGQVPVAPGAYHPTTATIFAGIGANMAAPAPSGPYGGSLSVFNGTSPIGAWKLWIEDSNSGDTGILGGGWSLTVNGQSCGADFNKSGSVEVQDIFDFLNTWFAGCP